MFRHRTVTAVIGLCFCMALLSLASAQQRQQVPRENIRGTAKLKGAQRGVLWVQNSEGDQYLLKADRQTNEVAFAGSADPSWLKPGMFVRFTARFNSKGQAVTEVRDLTVFSPGKETRIGVFPDTNLGGGELFADAKETKPKEQSASYLVAGRLTRFSSGKMTVAAGRTPVKVELTDNAKVQVNLSDVSLAQVGDTVTFDGWFYPMAKNQIYLRRLEVVASKPLSGEKKPTRAQPMPGEAEDSKDDGDDESEEDDS